jgi:hypothetical protein
MNLEGEIPSVEEMQMRQQEEAMREEQVCAKLMIYFLKSNLESLDT